MGFEERGSCYIAVGGINYANLMKLELRRSKSELTCEGTITVSWPGAEAAMASGAMSGMVDGAQGAIMLDGQLAATVIIDSRTSRGTPTSYLLHFKFRGKSSPLVDGVPDHKTGQENKQKPGQLAKKLAEGYDCKIQDKSGGGDQQIERFIIQEGESVERSIRRACREFGLTASENEKGDVELTKMGEEGGGGGGPLILGKNFLEWSVKKDMSPRQQKIKAKGNSIPTDKKYGKEAEELMGESEDQGVKFKKVMHMLVDTDHQKGSLKDRAKTEARRRQADGLNVTITTSTWSDEGGSLWKVGNQHMVSIPVDGVNDMLMIKEVRFILEHDKRYAHVTLCPKEGFGSSGGGGGDSGGSKGAGSSAFSPSIGG